jgi:succinyl-CoA synthetase beta subunit
LKLFEYQGKEAFARYGLPVPKGVLVRGPEDLDQVEYPAVLKAQVLAGGRGKAGGIAIAEDREAAEAALDRILGMEISGCTVKAVLAEEKLDIARELYLSITIDRTYRSPLLMASAAGGVDIESVADEKIFKRHLSPFVPIPHYVHAYLRTSLDLTKDEAAQLSDVVNRLFEAFKGLDAELVEVNPLVITSEGTVIAADSKVTIDDNAMYRHPEYAGTEEDITALEKEAKEKGITFVQLGGDIGVIANGAGLTMATLDLLNLKGGSPGVFLDLGGTDDPEKVKEAFLLMKKAEPAVIFLNIFGGITKCDTVALGVKDAIREGKIEVPIVARIKGLNEERAKEILRSEGMVATDTLEEAAAEAARLGGG